MAQTMNIKQVGYQIVGMTALDLWGGGEGVIPMEPVKLTQESFPTTEQIRESINDNGFGVQAMEGAVVRVDTIWEHGAKTYGEAQYINLENGYTDRHVMEVLSWGHPDSPVSIWELDDATLAKGGLA